MRRRQHKRNTKEDFLVFKAIESEIGFIERGEIELALHKLILYRTTNKIWLERRIYLMDFLRTRFPRFCTQKLLRKLKITRNAA